MKPTHRAGVSIEHLDHRQLLSVNLTGVVATDFPASTSPGVVVLPDTSAVQHPVISDPALASLIKVSGFDISGMRVSYDAADDILSIGFEQPLSQQAGQPGPVIAGDADNNGDDGTVNPAVTALVGSGFKDFPDFGGSEFMAAFLDLKDEGYADIAAGFAVNDPNSPKHYLVASAETNPPTGSTALDFGTGQVQQPNTTYVEQPLYEGDYFKQNSASQPNLEVSIDHFSQLYLQETGQALTPTSVIGLGSTAGSGDNPGVSKAFFPEQKFTLAQATLPSTTTTPLSPPVVINYHEDKVINTAHETLIRVNVIGSSGFNVAEIEPDTVTLGGAHPIFSYDRFINSDEWPDATFVFKGNQVTLPAGSSEATVTGTLTTGQTFSSSIHVFNKNASFYTSAGNAGAAKRQAERVSANPGTLGLPPTSPVKQVGATVALKTPLKPAGSDNAKLVNSTLKVDYSSTTPAAVLNSGGGVLTVFYGTPSALAAKPTLKSAPVKTEVLKADPVKAAVVAIKTEARPKVSNKLEASLNKYVGSGGSLARSAWKKSVHDRLSRQAS